MKTRGNLLRVLGGSLVKFLFFIFIIPNASFSQCNTAYPSIRICDMTIIDGDATAGPDGVINLYDEIAGLTPQAGDEWFDPGFNFALNPDGTLRLWDLDNASRAVNDYQFVLLNSSSGCTDQIVGRVNLILGPYSGQALPPSGLNEVNVIVCDKEDICRTDPDPLVDIDLFETLVSLESVPPPHLNGIWEYIGPPGADVNLDGSLFSTTIPYTPGDGRIDSDEFAFRYTVTGFDPACSPQSVTEVKISVVRQVFSGYASEYNICQSNFENGDYDAPINLRDNDYLLNEDLEGTWSLDGVQITSPDDSEVNLRTLYDDLVATTPRFGCQDFNFTYTVEQRSGVCEDASSTVRFTVFEALKPFTQNGPPPEICSEEFTDPSTDLYDFVEFFRDSNDVLFDYMDGSSTEDYVQWEFVSGPSDLNLQANFDDLLITNPAERHRGIINIPGAATGTYVFRYTVFPELLCSMYDTQELYNPNFCRPSINPLHPCGPESTEITIIISPIDYPGENTTGVNLCESLGTVDLRSLLNTNGTDAIVTTGVWTNPAGDVVDNTFVFPVSDTSQTFTFTYTTTSSGGCTDRADLVFNINKVSNAGGSSSGITLCSDNLTITLFDLLSGNPDTTGIWTGPFGYRSPDHLGVFEANNTMLAPLNEGVYTYTVPPNAGCSSAALSTVAIRIANPAEIGNDRSETFCKLEGNVNLYSLLDRNTVRTGFFEDTDNTDALTPDGTVDFETLTNGIYNFRYVVTNSLPCDESSLNVSIQIIDVPVPNVPEQEFCILDAKRLEDIEIDVLNYNWYATLESETPIVDNPLLLDNQVYYITNVDVDNCESERLAVVINILNTGEKFSNGELCTLDFQDGVSPNNDNQNDTFDLLIDEVYNIPEAFPDFDLKIYNRYGTLVYEGKRDTEEFRGESNISVRLGDDLPSGTYFYIFSPNFENNLPIQGSFYLSR
ncbi:gliding motility-associated C-terminal domain-containing protein [Aquimarina sp. 2304DJ70-9]|uniref:gliding motility-associated C-terminal domain-containing protein n=1 Tax=Aquimarina penaris TaxID=3231044 RepID=UPI003461E8AA